jgi:hypothetical protein
MPAVICFAMLAATGPLALSRTFGVFLATTLFVPALVLAGMGLLIWAFAERHPRRKLSIFLAVAAIAITAPIVYIVGSLFRNPIVFAFWSQTHAAAISRYATRDGIISTWDSWGIAGMENDSYLVAEVGEAPGREVRGCGRPTNAAGLLHTDHI